MCQSWMCAFVVALAASGCPDDPPGPPGPFDLIVATDKPEYSHTTDSVARTTLTNRSDQVVYLPMASYVVYERLRDGEWRDASPGSSSTASGAHPHLNREPRVPTNSSSGSTSLISPAPTASGTSPTRIPP